MSLRHPQQQRQLTSIHISGDARDIGVALGMHVALDLQVCLAQRLNQEVTRWRHSSRLEELRQAAVASFPDAYAELEGIAIGSGLPLDDIFLLNCIPDLPVSEPQSQSGCTTFLLPAEGNANEPAVIAHNEDASLTALCPWFIATICRKGQPSFSSLCYAGKLPGTAFAANSHGLVQTINDITPMNWQVGVPRGFLARAVLDSSDTLSAISLIRQTTRASGYHHSLCSTKDCIIYSVEAPAGAVSAMQVRSPKVHANHLVHGELSTLPQYVVGGSLSRQAFGESLVKLARKNPWRALRALSSDGHTISQSPSAENDWHQTIATAIFSIAPSEVSWHVYGATGDDIQCGRTTMTS